MNKKRATLYACAVGGLAAALWLDPAPKPAQADLVQPVSHGARPSPAADVSPAPLSLPAAQAATPPVARLAGPAAGLIALRDRGDVVDAGARPESAMFRSRSWLAPVAPVAGPSGPEVPSLPFTYVGKQQVNGEWRVFLQDKDDTSIVKERDVLAGGTYTVVSIKPPSMTFEHVPTHTVQTLEIE